MEQYIYDESNGLWYERDGDYYVPCLKLPEIDIGVWGERYLAYIREHKKLLHIIKNEKTIFSITTTYANWYKVRFMVH